jgi:hypothetical protein
MHSSFAVYWLDLAIDRLLCWKGDTNAVNNDARTGTQQGACVLRIRQPVYSRIALTRHGSAKERP